MAILNTLLGDEDFHSLDDKQLRTLEAKVTQALVSDSGVHRAIESAIEPRKLLER